MNFVYVQSMREHEIHVLNYLLQKLFIGSVTCSSQRKVSLLTNKVSRSAFQLFYYIFSLEFGLKFRSDLARGLVHNESV